MKNILITGGAGFVGTHLSNYLSKKNNVTVIDNLSNGNKSGLIPKVKFIKGDIRDDLLISKLLKKNDYVLHLAAMVRLRESIENPLECFSINVDGTINLVLNSLKNKVKKFIFASSCAVYPLNIKTKLKESMSSSGSTPYSISKVVSENLIKFYLENTSVKYNCLRFFNIYGEGQSADSEYAAVIPSFLDKFRKNENLIIYGDGNQTRDFINVHDVVKYYEIFLKSNKINGTFNIGSGKSLSINKLAEYFILKNKNLTKEYLPKKNGDAMSSFADMTKTNRSTKYKQAYNFKTKINELMNYV